MRIGLAAALVAWPAFAQSTDCYRLGNNVHCDTEATSRAPIDFLSAMGGVENLPDPAREARQASQTPAYASPPYAGWGHLADLIKAHKCDEAIDYAIRQGGTEAGLRTKALCS